MKKLEYILGIAAIALSVVACTSKEQNYTPTPAYPGDNVYFPSTINPTVALEQGATSFSVTIARNESVAKDAIDVPIISAGDAIDGGYISVPGTVSFAAGQTETNLVIGVDAEKLGLNNAVSVTLAIADEGATMPCGDASIALSISIPLPWLVFDTGTIYETPYWGEQETKALYYQILSDDIWQFKVIGCFGHDTIAGGEDYDVQDYRFYLNTKTNAIYIPKQYMGYTNTDGEVWFLDEPEYYNWYWYTQGKGYGYAEGTAEWFAFCDAFRAQYPDDYYPYYDGNGGFYLADMYVAGEPGTDLYLGDYVWYAKTGQYDSFICDNFVRLDFTSTVEYGGMFVDPDGNATPVINFTGAADVAGLKYIIASQNIDPLTLLSVIVVGEDENIQDITLTGGKASVQPALEVGIYRVVAVPYGSDGTLQTDDAVLCDFYFPGANAEKPEVEGELLLMSGTDVFSEAMIKQYGMTDYNSIGYVLYGKEIKSARYYLNESSVIATWTGTPEDLVAQYGNDFDADDISSINTNGYVAGGFLNRKAATEYQMIVVAENVYGSKKTFVATHTTAAIPYQGELVIGEYTIECSQPEYGTISVAPKIEENHFVVYDIAVADGSGWNAVYDPEKHTLTCDGTQDGYEEEGNLLGQLLGYWDSAKTQAYAVDSFASDESDGTDPIVFDVDPATHQLKAIHPYISLDVFSLSDGSYLGTVNEIADGAAITCLATNNAAVRNVNAAANGKSLNIYGSRIKGVGMLRSSKTFEALPSIAKDWSTGSKKVKGNGKAKFDVLKAEKKF